MNYQFKDADTVPWRKSTFAEGIEVKDLGTSDGRSMQIVRLAAGASFPLHEHLGPEFIYLLEGTAIQEGKSLSVSWAAIACHGDDRFTLSQSDWLRLSHCLHRLK